MKRVIDLCPSAVYGGTLRDTGEGMLLYAGKQEAGFTVSHLNADVFADMKYLVLDVVNNQTCNDAVWVRFTDFRGNALRMEMQLFPGIAANAVFLLKHTDGNLLFPPLLPGTLKSIVLGRGLRLPETEKLEIGLKEGYVEDRSLLLRSVYVTDEMPKMPMPEETTVDRLGQWKGKEWIGKIPDEETLIRLLRKEEKAPEAAAEGLDSFGGYTALPMHATGWFHTEKKDGRWFLVDPAGNAFFSTGVFGVYPGEAGWILGAEKHFDELPDPSGPFAPAYSHACEHELYRRKFSGMFPDDTLLYAPATANLIRAFGERWYDAWTHLTARRLHSWGINTLSMFSDPEFVKRSQMPYVIMLKGFPETRRQLFRDFPDVYSQEYEVLCRAFSRQLEPYAEDKNLIGYFLNNEPTWGFVHNVLLAEKVLESGKGSATAEELKRYLISCYDNRIADLNTAWSVKLNSFDELIGNPELYGISDRSQEAKRILSAFTDLMVERYAALPAMYTKKAAPHHLNLGMRFAAERNDSFLKTAKSFDVFSFNCYQFSPEDRLREWNRCLDMPMLIGEFHFGALDAGLPSPSLVQVKDQQARGEAYARYVHDAAAHPCGIGAHYFAYNDQPVWGRYDGENYQFGFVNICNLPYEPFAEAVARTNRLDVPRLLMGK